MFVDAEILEQLQADSMERFIEKLEEKASEVVGSDVSMVATHDKVAYGMAGGKLLKFDYMAEGTDLKVTLSEIDVPIVENEDLDGYIGDSISRVVREALDGDLAGEDLRNRLRELGKRIKPGAILWFKESAEVLRTSLEERELLKESDEEILGVANKTVTTIRFGGLTSERVKDFRAEIDESFKRLRTAMIVAKDACLKLDLSRLEDAAGVAAARVKAVVETVDTVVDGLDRTLRLSRRSDTLVLATLHDLTAERARDVVATTTALTRLASK